MAVTFAGFSGTPTSIKCQGGGLVMYARTNITLTAVASSPFDATFMDALGAPTGKVIAANFCKSGAGMVVNGGADGIAPYLDFANQALEWRNTKSGAIDQVPTAMGGGSLTLDLVVAI